MKRLLSSKKMYRVSYLFGFVMLMVGMLLSLASVPAQANYTPVDARKPKATAKAPKNKKIKNLILQAGTEFPTGTPSETMVPTTPAPVVTPMVAFSQDSTAICQMGAGPLTASVKVSLPAGQSAILQTAWKVAEPADLRTSEVYSEQTVMNGDTVTATGQWPGVRATDTAVEIHLGAILLDPANHNPISAGTGIDFYWYSWFCPVGVPSTVTPVPTTVPSETMVPTSVATETMVPTLVPTETMVPTTAETTVPTETMVPTLVPSETMVPTEVPTETMVPTMVPSETMVPTEVPTETMVPTMVPSETMVPTLVPTETMVPTTGPTLAPTETLAPTALPVIGSAVFQQLDTAVCQMGPGPLSAQVKVTLPSGVTNAVLQTAWKVAEPIDLRTSEQYTETPVTDGQVVTVTGQWPGVRSTDQVVEIHLGALLLDATTMNPIAGASVGSLDFYWYPWFCPFAGAPTSTSVVPVTGGTEVPTMAPTETMVPTQVPVNVASVMFLTQSTPLCQMTAGPVTAQVQVTLPAGQTAILQTAWKVAEPSDIRTNETYNQVSVKNGDVITVTGQWPGVRSFDQNVEVHLGAILLDAKTMNPISSGTGIDFYWNTSICAFTGPTAVPTEVTATPPPVTSPLVAFTSESKPLCMMNAGPITAQVLVTLPEGQTATLQTAWRVATPSDEATAETYNKVTVKNGDVITITAQWPGVRATDQVVSVHFGAILLDAKGNPISLGTGVDYYWYSWVCPFTAPATVTPPPVTTPSVTFTNNGQALCMMTAGPITAQVRVTLPEGKWAYLQTAWQVVAPSDEVTQVKYEQVKVKNGDVVTITAQWPGVRATDENVEVHFGAILLDTDGVTQISTGAGTDSYWYNWVCPVTVATAPVSHPSMPVNPSLVDVLGGWWHNLLLRMGWSS